MLEAMCPLESVIGWPSTAFERIFIESSGLPIEKGMGKMGSCQCCGVESRRLRKYQKSYGDESSEVLVCSNCFTEALDLSKDILDHAGQIAFAFTNGQNSYCLTTSDGREIRLEVQ